MYAKASVKDCITQLYLTSLLLFAFPFLKRSFPFLPLPAPLFFPPFPSSFRVIDFSHDVMLQHDQQRALLRSNTGIKYLKDNLLILFKKSG